MLKRKIEALFALFALSFVVGICLIRCHSKPHCFLPRNALVECLSVPAGSSKEKIALAKRLLGLPENAPPGILCDMLNGDEPFALYSELTVRSDSH